MEEGSGNLGPQREKKGEENEKKKEKERKKVRKKTGGLFNSLGYT